MGMSAVVVYPSEEMPAPPPGYSSCGIDPRVVAESRLMVEDNSSPVEESKEGREREKIHAGWVAFGVIGVLLAGAGLGISVLKIPECYRCYKNRKALKHQSFDDTLADAAPDVDGSGL